MQGYKVGLHQLVLERWKILVHEEGENTCTWRGV